jgi:S1-C subfamily serine protease
MRHTTIHHALPALAFAAVFWGVTSNASAALELPDLAEQTKPSVVHLVVLNSAGDKSGSGTGFMVSEDGHVATNDHVVGSAANVVAMLADGREVAVLGVLANDSDKDIAIIQLAGADFPPPLDLGNSGSLRQGEEVVVIGSPRGLSGTLSTGIISAIRGEGLDGGTAEERSLHAWAIQITAPISPGSSGSPIMTRDGKVVAVAVGIMRGEGSLNFGVPIEVVKDMMAALPADAKPQAFAGSGGMVMPGSGISGNLILSAVFFAAIALAFLAAGYLGKRRKRRN